MCLTKLYIVVVIASWLMTMHEELRLLVDEAMQGNRIDRLLAEHFPQITRSRFQKLLRDGMVTARGKKVRSAYRVLLGDEIRIRVPPPEPLMLSKPRARAKSPTTTPATPPIGSSARPDWCWA